MLTCEEVAKSRMHLPSMGNCAKIACPMTGPFHLLQCLRESSLVWVNMWFCPKRQMLISVLWYNPLVGGKVFSGKAIAVLPSQPPRATSLPKSVLFGLKTEQVVWFEMHCDVEREGSAGPKRQGPPTFWDVNNTWELSGQLVWPENKLQLKRGKLC